MRLPPFRAEWLDLPDDELGMLLLAWWIGAQAEKRGIDPCAIPEHIAEQIVIATRDLDTNQAHNAAFEKTLIKAASGDSAKAGILFRGHMNLGAQRIAAAEMLSRLPEDTKRGVKVRRSAAKGHAEVHGDAVEKETKRRQRLDLLDLIRKENPTASNRKIHDIAAAKWEEMFDEKVSYKAFERAENREKL